MDGNTFWLAVKNTFRQIVKSKFALLITVLLLICLGRRFLIKKSVVDHYDRDDDGNFKIIDSTNAFVNIEVPIADDSSNKENVEKGQQEFSGDEEEFRPRKNDYGLLEGGFRHINRRKDPKLKLKDLSSWSFRYKNMVAYSIKGRRPYMEDRFGFVTNEADDYQLFGVFDGHGGTFVAEYAEEKLLQNMASKLSVKDSRPINLTKLFIEETVLLDEEFNRIENPNLRFIGSTALFGYFDRKDLYIANVGDCRAVGISFKDRNVSQLTIDHKPNHPLEQKRIAKVGGTVIWNGVWRLGGILAVSRALGDLELKIPGWLTAVPDVFKIDLERESFDVVILASDGFWDVFTNEEILDYLKSYYFSDNGNKSVKSVEQSSIMRNLLRGAKFLVEEAYKKGSADNITLMIVKLV
uniref:PPM-type phosphatase domain-containing protein n=1 Tax=Romanomermis culicivorax TaxID=13658 RepID=A0A915KTX8_ROMCU